jgi:hypothetical protein
MAAFGPKPKAPQMPGAPPPVQAPTGDPSNGTNPTNPSFLAASASPSAGSTAAGKSLLGQ